MPPTGRTSCLRGLWVRLAGLLACGVTCLVGVASFTSEANLLLLLCGISLGLIAFSLVACVRMVRKVEVDRRISEATVAGRPFRVVYTVRNHRRWLNCWSIRISEAPAGQNAPEFPHAFIPVIPPRSEVRIELSAICRSRGRLVLPAIRVSCGFPFGLFTCSVDIKAPAELAVYPAVGRVRRALWQHPVDGAAARSADRHTGQDEFHGVREYRQGDNPRWIHWRRSARTGQLIVREHIAIQTNQVIVLLDPWPGADVASASRRSSAHSAGDQESDDAVQAELVISAAATSICDALDRGHRVGVICRAGIPVIVAPAGGHGHRQRLLRELALLSPGDGGSMDELIAGVHWSNGWNARCLLFTARVRECHSHAVRMLTGRTESVMTLCPQSGWFDKLFEGLAVQSRPGSVP
jgi:uncharacterized protein (DUF58 family)